MALLFYTADSKTVSAIVSLSFGDFRRPILCRSIPRLRIRQVGCTSYNNPSLPVWKARRGLCPNRFLAADMHWRVRPYDIYKVAAGMKNTYYRTSARLWHCQNPSTKSFGAAAPPGWSVVMGANAVPGLSMTVASPTSKQLNDCPLLIEIRWKSPSMSLASSFWKNSRAELIL